MSLLSKKQFQPSKKFRDARSAERQHGVRHLCASGPRVVLEAMLEIARGKPIDDVLRRYSKMPVSVYRIMGAGVLPVHAEFEAAWCALGRGEWS
jgi:hypothetical protein